MLRVPSSTVMRTAEEYIERSGELVLAPAHAHRTHADDADPLIVTFDNLISEEEAKVCATGPPECHTLTAVLPAR